MVTVFDREIQKIREQSQMSWGIWWVTCHLGDWDLEPRKQFEKRMDINSQAEVSKVNPKTVDFADEDSPLALKPSFSTGFSFSRLHPK